jgi:hypothetical protein
MGELIVGFLVGIIVGSIGAYIAFIKVLLETKAIAEFHAAESTEVEDYDEADWWKHGRPNPFG